MAKIIIELHERLVAVVTTAVSEESLVLKILSKDGSVFPDNLRERREAILRLPAKKSSQVISLAQHFCYSIRSKQMCGNVGDLSLMTVDWQVQLSYHYQYLSHLKCSILTETSAASFHTFQATRSGFRRKLPRIVD